MSGVRGMRWSRVKPCPSWGAYKRHIRHREVPCEACRQWVNDTFNAARQARKAAPRCGRVMQRYEASNGAMHDDPVCGRPAGHNGPCRTVQSLRRISRRRALSRVPCACGCGERPSRGSRYVRGHNRRGRDGTWVRAA